MTRPGFTILILLLQTTLLSAQDSLREVIEKLAFALTKGDAKSALDLFDPNVPDLPALRRNIEALSVLPDTNCAISAIAIDKTTNSGDSLRLETQWSLQTYPVQNGPLLDRHDPALITLRQVKGAWKITSVEPASILAPPDGAVFTLIAALAADLNDKNESGVLSAFDSKMKQYGEIDNDVDAMVTQNDVLCAIDIVSDRLSGGVHTLDLDWYIQLKSRADAGGVVKRRERVRAEVILLRNKWKISSITPLSVLSPFIDR